MTRTDAVVFTDEREVTVESVSVASPGPEELTVETHVSAISPGTEMLVYRGNVPTEMAADETLETLAGDLSYPTQYGYAAVGEVTAVGSAVDDTWLGRRVFAFHPHQRRFTVARDAVVPVPETVSDAAAAAIPTVETAVGFCLDGAPTLGERVVVFGCGMIGLTTVRLLATHPLAELVAVEPDPARRERARSAGADRAVEPADADRLFADREPDGADLVYELSGQPAALDDAIGAVGYDGRVIVGSWYGEKRASLNLGGRFHRDRITVESSQVSTLAPVHRGRWDTDRRLRAALDRLGTVDPDALVTDRVPLAAAADAYRRIDEGEGTLHVLLTYD